MPPKNSTSKKTEQKKKDKVIEDKTFGLKNKKGTKQQKFIQQVEKQVQHGGNFSSKQMEKEREEQKNKKDLKKKQLAEINDIFKPVQQQLAKGVDPKSVLCSYFKLGTCGKGAKCKFSHDLNIERKGEKRSMYFDEREQNETSEDWDEEKLKDVVEKKHGNEANKPTTSIVCKFFLDAVENGKYGWFWKCPTGEKCIYKHALPPGFVLKKDKKRLEKGEEISLEDLIERERAALGASTTKVTLGSFLRWKKQKLQEKADEQKKKADKKKSDMKSGKEGGISGREMFMFNPDLANGETMDEGDAEFDFKNMEKDPENDEEESSIQYKDLDLNALMEEYKDIDDDGTLLSVAKADRFDLITAELAKNPLAAKSEEEKNGAVAIDENLFDDADLDDLEDELEELNVSS